MLFLQATRSCLRKAGHRRVCMYWQNLGRIILRVESLHIPVRPFSLFIRGIFATLRHEMAAVRQMNFVNANIRVLLSSNKEPRAKRGACHVGAEL